jgi:hypothetical protein
VQFANPEAGIENTDSASKDSKLQQEMSKLDGWTQIPMKNARRALMMALPPPKQHEEILQQWSMKLTESLKYIGYIQHH